ncbi:MAG: hypothetical protein GY765_33205 [bacterium]|nr:hypothetical protein [bacterium]
MKSTYFKHIGLCLALLLCLSLFFSGCKKEESNDIAGDWVGTLTVDLSHAHEAFQDWAEIITHADGTREEIIHMEHIQFNMTNKVEIEFRFNIVTPLYEARIEGSGDAKQQFQFSQPVQCQITGTSAPDFLLDVYGTVGSSTFALYFVPRSIPVTSVTHTCQNVYVPLPVYGNVLVDIIAAIQPNVPAQSGITAGGSDIVNAGGGFQTPLAFTYHLTLNKQ